MDCDICFEDKILIDEIAFFKCTHHICKNCYNSLKKRLCPFCRKKIKILSLKQVDDKSQIRIFEESSPEDDYSYENNYYVEYENDFIIPVIRKNRNELKRKSKEKKKNILTRILNENYNNNFLKIIPTLRKRKYKKLQLLFK